MEYDIIIGEESERVHIAKESATPKETYALHVGQRIVKALIEKREQARIIVSISEKVYSVRQLKRSQNQVEFLLNGELVSARLKDKFSREKSGTAPISDLVTTNFPARVVKIARAGFEAKEGEVLVVLEAMKMEAQVKAPRSCVVVEVFVREGEMVSSGGKLARLKFI